MEFSEFCCHSYLKDIYLLDMSGRNGATSKALLGLLSIHPMSGYDLRQLIPRSIGHFWSESYGQIYPALKQMTAAGLVERETEQQEGKPERHVYSLTKAGRNELGAWLKLPPERAVPRNELLLKVFFGAHVSAEVSREHVTGFMKSHEQALKTYEAMAKTLRKEECGDPQLPYWLMTLSMGRHQSAAMVEWCKETLKELEKLGRAGTKKMR
jgi:PadR family transcriptional regulator, regulatory protein AphA